MEREENENFSTEDPNNVLIPSSLGPIIFEIWKYIIYALNNDNITIVLYKNFFDIFLEIIKFRPQFFDSERVFSDLLPCIIIVFNKFILEYNTHLFNYLIYDFIFEFVSRIVFINKYNVKYLDNLKKFVEQFQKELFIDKNEEKINEINNNLNLIYSYFESN
jgi:hypothetical protein